MALGAVPDERSVRPQVAEAEWKLRVDLAALYRLVALEGWDDLVFTHLSLRVDNLAATLADLKKAGVQILQRTHIDIPAFEAAAIFITDPDGTLIELVQAPGDPAVPPGA